MKFLILIGNCAVGKMTVGQALCRITDFHLFHNHMMIEPVIDIFGGHRGDVVGELREVIFRNYAKSDNYGLIFTFMMAFDVPAEWDYVSHISDIFRDAGAEVYYVELVAPQSVRLERNRTENRLANKASKRDLAASEQRLLRDDALYRCESYDGEVTWDNYLKIDTTELSPDETAERIKDYFGF
ncbi:MAG: shikimate kinase [Ruminococcaceae bacterium]|nr:shikimate kinase [Oscillospiraceae bacterium]